MSQHTPTPWRTVKEPTIGLDMKPSYIIGIVDQGNMKQVALLGKDKQENAEFIVRACNAHEDLIESLRVMVKTFNCEKIDPLKSFASIEKARKALEKAGVKV